MRKFRYVFISIIFGLFVWIFDSIADYYIFYQGNSFWDLILFDTPGHEIYIRLLILFAFVIFGVIVNKILLKKEQITLKLAMSQENYKTVIENAADGIVLHKLNGEIVEANETICRALGYSEKEMHKLKIQDLDPDYQDREKRGDFWVDLSKKSIEMFRASQIRKDGSIFRVEIKLTLVTINSEKMVVSIIRDIEDRVKIERELEGYRVNLEEKIKERTLELENKNKELSSKNSELERYNELFVGREFRIKELKEKILELEKKFRTNKTNEA